MFLAVLVGGYDSQVILMVRPPSRQGYDVINMINPLAPTVLLLTLNIYCVNLVHVSAWEYCASLDGFAFAGVVCKDFWVFLLVFPASRSLFF